MAQEEQVREELLIRDRATGQPRPYYVAAENINLGDDEEYESLPDRLNDMQDEIDAAGSGNGTVNGVKMNGTTNEPDEETGIVDLGTVITSHQSLAALFGKVAYNSSTHRINFYGKDDTLMETVLGYIDCSAFIVDGMLSNVEVKNVTISGTSTLCMVFSFNTDAGKQDINVPVSSIFNAALYYTKTQADTTFQLKLVSGTNIKTINNTSLLGEGNISIPAGEDGDDGKSAYQSYLDTTSDDPVLTEAEWVASLKGAKGDQGDTVVLDTEGLPLFKVVNDLTTGGGEDALSAEMGKRLRGMIDDVQGGEEDLSPLESRFAAYINTSGSKSSANQYWMCTDFIALSDISTIDFFSAFSGVTLLVALYDENKSFVRGRGQANTGTLSINSMSALASAVSGGLDGCVYVRFSYQKEDPTGRCVIKHINDVGLYHMANQLNEVDAAVASAVAAVNEQVDTIRNLVGENEYELNVTDATSLAAAISAGKLEYGYLKRDGGSGSATAWVRTKGYISLADIDICICKSIVENAVANMLLYDSNKTLLDYVASASISSVPSVANAAFAKFCIQIENAYELQVGKEYGPGIKQTNEEVAALKSALDDTLSYGTIDIPLHQSNKYIKSDGTFGTTSYHSLYKYVGEGKIVRITTSSDDNDIHPLAGLYDSNDNLIKWLLYPNPQTYVLKSYTFDVEVAVGQSVIISAYNPNKPSLTYILEGDLGLTKEQLAYDEATARARFEPYRNDIKAVMLDCGRKYFSVNNIKSIIDAVYDAGLNTLELHFSENQGLRLALNDMNVSVEGVTYDLTSCLGDGITTGSGMAPDGSNKYLTQSEMDTIIAYAAEKNIRIVPALDMPGHMGAILENFPQFKLSDTTINYGSPLSRKFALAILKKYATYFASKNCAFFNFCADEAGTGIAGHFLYSFINEAAHIIIECGMIPMAFNDFMGRGANNYTNKGIVVDYWWGFTTGAVTPAELKEQGYALVNADHNYYLIYKSGTNPTPSNWAGYRVNNFANVSSIAKPDGGMFCIWCDQGNKDGDDEGDAFTPTIVSCIGYYGTAMARGFYRGQMKLDTTSGKPLWWNGSAWVDASGTAIS